jgi:nucleotide-binding universal stress UspA family protein
MFRRALIPLDGSAWSDRIVRFAHALLEPGASLCLLQVAGEGGGMASVEERLDEAAAHLERVRAGLDGFDVTADVMHGDSARVIREAAERLDPDVVVMATHGRSGPSRWFRGSVAESVVRHVSAPVLVANPGALDRAPELRPRRILMPVDGSAEGLAALSHVERLARASGAEVVLLTVAEPVPALGATAGMAVAPVAMAPPVAALEALLDAPRRALQQLGIRARALVAYGPSATEILVASEREEVDLIAMTTHARHGVERWVLGSVTEEVLRHGRRPVLVLRAAVHATSR